jgi:3-oxoacyl-[acyl-carrier-protein] synthase-1
MARAGTIWPLAITACSVVTALGAGTTALRDGLLRRQSGLRPCDAPDMPKDIWIGRVAGLENVALPQDLAGFTCRNNRLAELALRTDGFAAAVDRARLRYGSARIAVVLGTSTSGIGEAEDAYARRSASSSALPADFDYAKTQDLQSLPLYVRARFGLKGPAMAISTACTSSARASMVAADMIAAGLVDAAVVGGVDSLCRMTLHGFASLELLSRGRPTRPCAADRDGISIGEAAGLMLLERPMAENQPLLLGAGASSDGHHMSSPHPEGLGAVTAMRAALLAAQLTPDEIDYINLHGTGTRANDAMEDKAVSHVFADRVPCSSTKGWTGHTLGASAAIEACVAIECLDAGLIPGCLGVDAPDETFTSDVATANRKVNIRRVLSNSFGFGGSNCSLIIGYPT